MRKYAVVIKIIYPLLLLLFLSSCKDSTVAPVNYGNIQGTVLKPDGKTAVAGALITTNPATVSITTDNSGKFKISSIPVDNYSITASKTDYSNTSVNVSVKASSTTQATIILSYSTSNAPGTAVLSSPANRATEQPVSITLKWKPPTTSLSTDTIKYNVYLFNSQSPRPEIIASQITDTSIAVSNLSFNTTYFWQVNSRGTDTATTYGNIWSFTTRAFPNNHFIFARIVNGNYQIFSSDSTVDNTIQLTDNNNRNWWPRFNPVQNKIAFTSDGSVEPQIYVINTDGTNLFKLTNVGVTGYGNYGTGFCWSPDGSRILFSHNDKLYRINSDGSGLTQIATAPAGRNFKDCSYSPDGSKIVVLTVGSNNYDSEIYLMNSNGSNMSLLVDNSPGATAGPTFSIDGEKILYTHDISGYQDNSGRELNSHIFELTISTKNSVDLSTYKNSGTNDLNPRYSPNGAYIIFENGSNVVGSQKDIWVMSNNVSSNTNNNRHLLISNGVMPDWK